MTTVCVDVYSLIKEPEVVFYEDEINIHENDIEELIKLDLRHKNRLQEYFFKYKDKIKVVKNCDCYRTTDNIKIVKDRNKYINFSTKPEYKGYVEINLLDYPEETQYKVIEYLYSSSTSREKIKVDKIILNLLNINIQKNEYLIIHVDDKNSYIYKDLGDYLRIVEHKNIKKFLLKDNYQKIAYDSCINPHVATIIDGLMGSGKTLISLLAAISLIESKEYKSIKIIRPNIGIDKNYDIGFLPGNIEDKLNPWIGGVITNLSFIFGNEVEAEKYMKTYIQSIPINMVQGYSIHDSVVIVDESQFLNLSITKQIISRVAESSKLIILYDEKQSYNVVEFIGVKKLIKMLPNELFSYVKLQNIYRSKLTEFIESFV